MMLSGNHCLVAACIVLFACQLGVATEDLLISNLGRRQDQQRHLLQVDNALAQRAPCGRYPHMVSLRNQLNQHKCGGVLIAASWVLTAASCVDINIPNSLGPTPIIVIGACDLDDQENENGEVEMFLAEETIIQKQWTGNRFNGSDVALLRLPEPSNHVSSGLPSTFNQFRLGDDFVALGWIVRENGFSPESLQQATKIQFLPNSLCNSNWRDVEIQESMMCTFGDNLNGDTCGGGFGGPLLRAFAPDGEINAGNPALDLVVGIASFSDDDSDCGDSDLPHVYTRISSFRDWIDTQINEGIPSGASQTPTDPPTLSSPAPAPTTAMSTDPSSSSPAAPPPIPIATSPSNSTLFSSIPPEAVSPSMSPNISTTGTTTPAMPPMSPSISPSSTIVPPEPATSPNGSVVMPPAPLESPTISPSERLWAAAHLGSLKGVQDALEDGADVDVKLGQPPCPCTPLIVAAEMGNLETVEALINAEADVNAVRETDGVTALFLSSQLDHLLVVNALIEDSADVNEANDEGVTALMVAAENGHIAILNALLEARATHNRGNNDGITALHFATVTVGNESVDIVKLLLNEGATVDAKALNGETPLMWAAWFGNTEVVQIFVDNGADISIENDLGETAGDQICGCLEGGIEVPQLPCAPGGCDDPMTRQSIADILGTTEMVDPSPEDQERVDQDLWGAALNGDLDKVKLALVQGANVDVKLGDFGSTPLIVAAQGGHLEVVLELLAAGANVDATRDSDGTTALFKAAQNGHANVTDALLAAGADVDKERTSTGSTALFVASQNGHVDAAVVLIEAGADVNSPRGTTSTPLFIASQEGHVDVVQALVDSGADVNKPRDNGATPLAIASQVGHVSIVELLIAAGADPMKANRQNLTPLHRASAMIGPPSEVIVNGLLDAGAEVDARASDGDTPLIWAAQMGNAGTLEILLNRGANKDIANKRGGTALNQICKCLEYVGQEGIFQCPEGGCDQEGTQGKIEELLT